MNIKDDDITPKIEEHVETIQKDWIDPLPPPVLEDHEGFKVVREDLVVGGSKVRSGDYFVKSLEGINELVYGSSPSNGYAQIALPILARRHKKRAVVFMAKRAINKITRQQKLAMDEGVDMRWVDYGMLNVTEKRAKDYALESNDRFLVPIGLDNELVIATYAVIARRMGIAPKEVWTVGSSGTLTRGLQLGWPDAEFHCVSVGHKGDFGRAIVYRKRPSSFKKDVKPEESPPFPSVQNYDAKAWQYMREHAAKDALFWNVSA